MTQLLPRDQVLTERVTLTVEDGTAMGAYLAWPAGDATPRSGVVVTHELFGVSAHVRDVAERLAALGYLALAPDLYHRNAEWLELPHSPEGRDAGFAQLHAMTREGAIADVRASVDALRARGAEKVGILGLSMGGHVAYLAATALDVDAVAVAYGGWIPTTDIPISQPDATIEHTPSIKARMLLLAGTADHAVDGAQRAEVAEALARADVRHEVVEYDGVAHGFLCDRRSDYDAAAAEDAWWRIETLFAEELRV
jgi:carboxymethylenebutenolidase